MQAAWDLLNVKIWSQHLNSLCHREEKVTCIDAMLNQKHTHKEEGRAKKDSGGEVGGHTESEKETQKRKEGG